MIELKYGKRKVINYRGAKVVVGGLTARNKIDILLYISKELGKANEVETLYQQVLYLAQEIFEPDNCTLRVFDGEFLQPVAYLNENTGKRRPLKPGEGFSGAIFSEGKAKLILDLEKHPEYLDRFETTRCVLCVPITNNEEKLGTISIEKTISHFYKKDDLEILEAMASQIGLALTKVRLIAHLQEERKKQQKIQEQLEWDLRMGRSVQTQIIQKTIPPWNGLYFSAFYQPMVEVSGDYFQVYRSREHVTIFIADVSGHGVPAALVTMTLHHQFHSCMERGLGLLETLEEVTNNTLPILPEGIYFTGQILRIYADFSFSFVNAGHVKMYQYQKRENTFLSWDGKGIPLGFSAMKRDMYEERFGEIKPGDFLIFLTDGMTEQRNTDKEEVGINRILDWLKENIEKNPVEKTLEETMQEILAKWKNFTHGTKQSDDLTLLLVGFSPLYQQAKETYQKAKVVYQKKDYTKAETLALQAYELELSYSQNLLLLSKLNFHKRDWLKASEYLNSYLIYSGDKNPEIHYLLGLAYVRLGNIKEAKKIFKKTLALKQDFLRAHLALATCYLREKAFPKAKKTLQIASRLFPQETKINQYLEKVEKYEHSAK